MGSINFTSSGATGCANGLLRPRFNDTTEMVSHGSNSYGARVTDAALGTIRSLEAAVQGFEERVERLARDYRCQQAYQRTGGESWRQVRA
jgi:hypothetical protein